MNAPCARRCSLRIAAKAASDNQSVISVPSCTGVSTRRASRLGAGPVAQIRRSARLAKLPRISYAGMDCDEE